MLKIRRKLKRKKLKENKAYRRQNKYIINNTNKIYYA